MRLLDYAEFEACVRARVPRFTSAWLNSNQEDAVSAPPTPPVFIVAGPGTGKTTVLALRVLRHVFVDGYPPDSIMATTFTRKAANELRSRILSWGVATHQEALAQATTMGNSARVAWLLSLDINKVQTGTLDAIGEQMIADDRQPGEITPTVVETFMANGLMRKHVMFVGNRHASAALQTHLTSFNPQFPQATTFASKLKISRGFADRAIQDSIDMAAYSLGGPGHVMLTGIVEDYHEYLTARHLMDFTLLEKAILDRLVAGRLVATTQSLKALLVDEFQDTNYLQEQIYYYLCSRSDAALTVVGDDDQALYRFRGATVEIFSNFESRLVAQLGSSWQPTRIDLVNNYRSTQRIVGLFNHFIGAEAMFQTARAPGKLPSVAAAPWAADPMVNFPVLGLFRANLTDLADDLCGFLGDIFRGAGHNIPISGGSQLHIERELGGDFGDGVLLTRTAEENNHSGASRLPLLMRQNLRSTYGVEVFNPRGRTLASILEVSQCLGIMLCCLDPSSSVQNAITAMKPETRTQLNNWRAAALALAGTNPAPGGLQDFLSDWATFQPRSRSQWPREWPLLELMFTAVAWLPLFQTSPEGQVYLEAIARSVAEAGRISSFKSVINFSDPSLHQASVRDAIREVFQPIAEKEVDIDEEIMPYVPRSNFPIMTIHQAKGLEFPLVVVDVGSDWRSNHASQRPFRFPDDGNNTHFTEEHIANFSPVGPARQGRQPRLRAFDDIRRLYYVAKSRPQNILLLIGLTTQLGQPARVPAIATGDVLGGYRTYDFIPSTDWSILSPVNTVALI